MAEQRRRSSGAKSSGSTGRSRSTGTRKKTSGETKRASGNRSSGGATRTRKATSRKTPARKSAATSKTTKSQAETLGEWKVPETPRAAEALAASRPVAPILRADRRSGGRMATLVGVLLLGSAAVVALLLILSGNNDENASLNTGSTPTAVALTPSQTSPSPAKAPPPAAPVANPTARTTRCHPIVGSGTQNSGKTYPVTSSATDGDPAGCAQAHAILLSALNGSGGTIGDWHCTTQPSGPTIASCTSAGGRKIQARG